MRTADEGFGEDEERASIALYRGFRKRVQLLERSRGVIVHCAALHNGGPDCGHVRDLDSESTSRVGGEETAL